MGSPTQIHQIIMNLCTNAAHAMEKDGGTLDVSIHDITINKKVQMSGIKDGDYIVLTVSDTGIGISSKDINNIFDPYFTTKPVGEGTGLGLAVVHGIVETYGGKITIDSKVNNGTVVNIYLPTTEKRKSFSPIKDKQFPSGDEHILFVDDEIPIAKVGSRMLRQMGYTVVTTTDSMEALELFKTNPKEFDLVISDMTMPKMTGDKLAIELLKIRPGIPIILCTGYSKKISKETATKIGIKAFTYKPIIQSNLAKTVRKVLDDI